MLADSTGPRRAPELFEPPPQGPALAGLGCTFPVADLDRYEAVFLAMGLRPEFYFTADDVLTHDRRVLDRAGALGQRLGGATVHAPFVSVFSGAPDADARERSVDLLLAAADCAAAVGGLQAVLHTGYDPRLGEPFEAWFARAVPGLAKVTARFVDRGVRPLVENCREEDPGRLLRLLEALHPETRVCLDPSHAAVATSVPVGRWLDELGELIREVHLNNNRGGVDEHLSLDEGGSWDARATLDRLVAEHPRFLPVLEPRDERAAQSSVAALRLWGLLAAPATEARSPRGTEAPSEPRPPRAGTP